MTKDLITLCLKMIKEWNVCSISHEKDLIRNKLFIIIQPFMAKWIASILAKKSQYASDEEIKSKSWDSFKYCLRLFKEDKPIPLPNHFYAYTKFFLSIPYSEKQILKNETKGPFVTEVTSDREPFHAYEDIEELKYFRSLLPQEYVSVFDDAIMSLVPSNSQKLQRLEESSLGYARYREAKKIFKIVIEFLLTR